jgi:hypothetical protein
VLPENSAAAITRLHAGVGLHGLDDQTLGVREGTPTAAAMGVPRSYVEHPA